PHVWPRASSGGFVQYHANYPRCKRLVQRPLCQLLWFIRRTPSTEVRGCSTRACGSTRRRTALFLSDTCFLMRTFSSTTLLPVYRQTGYPLSRSRRMTKPTGRPRGRTKTKEYTTLMARVPPELADRVKRYAAAHRQPIAVVMRDALLLLMDEYPSSADLSAP